MKRKIEFRIYQFTYKPLVKFQIRIQIKEIRKEMVD